MKTSVLIGSSALKEYGYNIIPKDTDILVDTKLYEEEWKLLFENKSNKIDLIMATSGTNKELFDFVNMMDNAKRVERFGISVLLPPLELLYAVKKSHIHRVIPYSTDSSVNTEIWKKNMEMYIWMRNKLGYDRMDEIIYGDQKYGLPLDHTNLRNEAETELEFMVRNIFIKRFDETTKKHGDTFNVMDMEKGEFFNDNVPRIVEHDELHKMVAQVCRGISDEPYRMFQKDVNNAVLDKNLYFAADKKYRYILLREEIMVLFLERKIIPELVHCGGGEQSYEFSDSKLMKYMDDVISNYCTNLCESGHSWLRQYVLDHYDIYSSYRSYDIEKLLELAFKLTNIKRGSVSVQNNDIDKYTDIFDMGEKLKSASIYWDTNNYSKYDGYFHLDFTVYSNSYEYVTLDNVVDVFNELEGKANIYADNIDVIKKFNEGDYFETLYLHDENDNENTELLYSLANNVGICDEGMFVLDIKVENKKYLSIDSILFDHNNVSNMINPDIKNSEFAKKRSTYCYYSDYDPDCGWANKITNVYHKLEVFGSCDGLMGKLCEILARKILDVKEDEYRRDYGEGDSDSDGYSDVRFLD